MPAFIPNRGSYTIPDEQRFPEKEFNPHKLHQDLFTLLQAEAYALGTDTAGNKFTDKYSLFKQQHQVRFDLLTTAIAQTEILKKSTPAASRSNQPDATLINEATLKLLDNLEQLCGKFESLDLHYCTLLRFDSITDKKSIGEDNPPGLESGIELAVFSPGRSA